MEPHKKVRFPHKSKIFGVLFMLIGSAMLLYTTGVLPKMYDLWPVIVLLFGLVLLYFVFAKGAYEVYLFPGFLFVIIGVSFIIINILPPSVELRRIWPVFMINAGVSLLLYGYSMKKEKRINLVIPAWSIILLALIFLLFSLDIIKMSFLSVVRVWWPLIFLVFGGFLLGESLLRKK
ncbi:MAG: hypothetical protein JXB03_13075 [Spirochaetales bacterium]|nr:hypothetical protein [Spirochaetales bacterium]